jgi:hypothetical protein
MEHPWYYARRGGIGNWLYTMLMGLLWFGGNVLYGVGANMWGDMGTTVGWGIFMIAMIISGSISGMFQGEWKGTSVVSRTWMGVSLVLLCAAVAIAAVGSRQSSTCSSAHGGSTHSSESGARTEWV